MHLPGNRSCRALSARKANTVLNITTCVTVGTCASFQVCKLWHQRTPQRRRESFSTSAGAGFLLHLPAVPSKRPQENMPELSIRLFCFLHKASSFNVCRADCCVAATPHYTPTAAAFVRKITLQPEKQDLWRETYTEWYWQKRFSFFRVSCFKNQCWCTILAGELYNLSIIYHLNDNWHRNTVDGWIALSSNSMNVSLNP